MTWVDGWHLSDIIFHIFVCNTLAMVATRRVLNPNYRHHLVGGPYCNDSVFCPTTGNLCEPQTDADAVETLGRLDSLVSGQRHGHGRRVHVSKGKYIILCCEIHGA